MSSDPDAQAMAEKLKNNSVVNKPVDNSTNTVDKSKTKVGGDKPKKNGGARPGAGRPKGSMNAKTKEKMAVKKEFEDRVAHHAHELFNAQVTLAKGTQFLIKRIRIKTAKGFRWTPYERVTDPEEMVAYLDGKYKNTDAVYYLLTAEKPDAKAIDSLLDRAFGKAPQNLNIKDDRENPIETILKGFGLLEDEGNSDNAGEAEGS
jgi:hypothetical protein